MKVNKTAKHIILVFLILNLITLVYLTSFKLNAFNEGFHKKEFEKYGIYGKFPNYNIDKINSDLLSYLKGKSESYNKELFNQREISHLEDVKIVIEKIDIFYYLVSIISIVLIIALFLLDKKRFLRNISIIFFLSGLSIMAVSALLLIMVKLNFGNAFTIFHQIFFAQGGWLFSPSDNIINLYPLAFFYDTAKKIFIHVFLYGNLLIGAGISLFFLRKWRILQL